MKKVPSYPKITAKTNITVTQTQNININSPKATVLKKGFKNQIKKIKPSHAFLKNQSGTNLVKYQILRTQQPARKSSKKGLKQIKDIVNEKSIKSSKSQRQLIILSEKLKRLEQKIKKIKEKEKVQKTDRIDKNSSTSHRSFSKNRQNSSCVKRQANSSRKQLSIARKYFIARAQSHKTLKKSYSDKLQFQIPISSKRKKKSEVLTNSNQEKDQKYQKKSTQKQKHDEEVLHKFVTQVPNMHSHNLKESVQKSLGSGYYAVTPSNKSQQMQEQNQKYYIGKAIKSLVRPALFPIRQHLIQSLQTLQFLQNVKRPSNKQIQKKQISLSLSKFRQTVILDLDETLIHCNETLHLPHDVKLNIKFPTGQKIDAGVNIRPYAKQFLQQLSKICEVIVFTASHQCYANVVLDHLDPKKQLISHRLFRQHCWQTQQGVYIKDLRVIKNRSLQNILLVDNAAYSYFFQLQNGVPIVPYYDDKEDKQLIKLLEYIKQIMSKLDNNSNSVRKINEKYFRLVDYCKFEDIEPLVEQLYASEKNQVKV